MRKWVYLVVLLLASMYGPKTQHETAQVKLIATTASIEKAKALRAETIGPLSVLAGGLVTIAIETAALPPARESNTAH